MKHGHATKRTATGRKLGKVGQQARQGQRYASKRLAFASAAWSRISQGEKHTHTRTCARTPSPPQACCASRRAERESCAGTGPPPALPVCTPGMERAWMPANATRRGRGGAVKRAERDGSRSRCVPWSFGVWCSGPGRELSGRAMESCSSRLPPCRLAPLYPAHPSPCSSRPRVPAAGAPNRSRRRSRAGLRSRLQRVGHSDCQSGPRHPRPSDGWRGPWHILWLGIRGGLAPLQGRRQHRLVRHFAFFDAVCVCRCSDVPACVRHVNTNCENEWCVRMMVCHIFGVFCFAALPHDLCCCLAHSNPYYKGTTMTVVGSYCCNLLLL